MAAMTAMMGEKKTLRYPFKVAADAGTFVVDKVNKGVDSSLDYSKKSWGSVKRKCVSPAPRRARAMPPPACKTPGVQRLTRGAPCVART